MKRLLKQRTEDQGFTLIEMLIVVAIIAVLAAVAIVAYSRHVRNSRLVKEKAFLADIQAKQEAYFQQFGFYCNIDSGPHPSSIPGAAAASFAGEDAQWQDLGVRPDDNRTFFQWTVVASVPPGHAASGESATLGITSAIPWYYVKGEADMDEDGTTSLLYVTSQKTELWTVNDGE